MYVQWINFLSAGNTNNKFIINSQGHIITAGRLNIDGVGPDPNPYVLDVQVEDTAGQTVTQAVTINVNPVNQEKPTCTFGQRLISNVNEADPAGKIMNALK